MDVGVIVPQGRAGEDDGWGGGRAGGGADAGGPPPGGGGAMSERVRLGHVVICTAFRNPALTAKMIGTLDVISGGRMELGIGAGWKEDEWLAYGYGFPHKKTRLALLADHL